TRFSRDWSSDVCSSDLAGQLHLTRSGNADEVQGVADGNLHSFHQSQACLAFFCILGVDDPLGVVVTVEQGGQFKDVVGDPVGRQPLRRFGDNGGEFPQQLEQVQLFVQGEG